MKNLLNYLALAAVGFSINAQAATCRFEIPDYSRGPGALKGVNGSDLVLNFRNDGVISSNNHKEIALTNSRTAQYYIEGFSVKSGCQKIIVSVGIKENVDTWSTIFSNWCEGDDLIIYAAGLGNLNLRCKF